MGCRVSGFWVYLLGVTRDQGTHYSKIKKGLYFLLLYQPPVSISIECPCSTVENILLWYICTRVCMEMLESASCFSNSNSSANGSKRVGDALWQTRMELTGRRTSARSLATRCEA